LRPAVSKKSYYLEQEEAMDIRIHLTYGEIFTFCQNNHAVAEAIIKSIQPNKIFTQPQIVIRDSTSTNGIACSSVERVEFITEIDPRWSLLQQGKPMALISKREYERRLVLTEMEENIEEEGRSVETDLSDTMLFNFMMRSGKQLFGETSMKVRERLVLRLSSRYDFEPEGIYGKRDGGGHVLINSQNIIKWKLNCSLPDAGRNIWEANRVMSF
jgi:hypothetical protein